MLTAVTYATDTENMGFRAHSRSAELHRVPLVVFGKGDVWKGWGSKLNCGVRAAHDLPPDIDTIMMVDGYDTIFLSGPEEIEAKFSTHFLCSTEKACWPDPSLAKRYPPNAATAWQYINGGAWIANRGWLRRQDWHIEDSLNDQPWLTQRYLEGAIERDDRCQIFFSAAHTDPDEVSFRGKRLIVPPSSKPSLIHFNGRTHSGPFMQRIGYGNRLWSEAFGYADRLEEHKSRAARFTSAVNSTKYLKDHRDFVDSGVWGFGERAFHQMWDMIVEAMPRSFKFLEIGVYKGQVVSLIPHIAKHMNKSAKTYGVTMLSDYSGPTGKFPKFPQGDYGEWIGTICARWGVDYPTLIVGDSTARDSVIEADCNGPYDIVYIDGCHEYSCVAQDLTNYGKLVKPGGFLVIDDASAHLKMPHGFFTGIEDVSRAVDECIVGRPQWFEMFSVVHNRVFYRRP